jgi:hypothetical protein
MKDHQSLILPGYHECSDPSRDTTTISVGGEHPATYTSEPIKTKEQCELYAHALLDMPNTYSIWVTMASSEIPPGCSWNGKYGITWGGNDITLATPPPADSAVFIPTSRNSLIPNFLLEAFIHNNDKLTGQSICPLHDDSLAPDSKYAPAQVGHLEPGGARLPDFDKLWVR